MEIKVKDVSYHYQRDKKFVLENINMNIKSESINGVLGSSGSGKTTLLELLVALRSPETGYIQMGNFIFEKNRKMEDMNAFRFQVGIVFQFPEEQIFNKTVKAELEMGMKFFNYKLEQLDERVKDALLMVGLDESYLNVNPLNLSNGEKRRVALASILIYNPKVLILDEPTIGLDNKSKKSFLRLLRMLKTRYKKTIIIASHDTEMIHQLADYIFVLGKGKVILEGDKYTVFKEEKLLHKYHVQIPKVIEFSNAVYQKKNIKLGYRDDINDLIKDIYRYAR